MTVLATATAPSTSTAKTRGTHGAKAPQASKSSKANGNPTKKAKAATAAPVSGAESPALVPATRDLLVPLEKLVLSEANVRRVFQAEGIEELAALLESQGQLQRLAVIAHVDDTYAVVAGVLLALGRLRPVRAAAFIERPVVHERVGRLLAMHL